MADNFKTQDGQTVSDGDKARLVLMYDYEAVEAVGTVRRFEQVERVYDEEGIAVGKTSTKHWEIVTGDAHHPAIGFLPENVKTRLGK
jgi:hypothetical protein